ncbi:hypothetical protein [uncultured Lamprocystis sp.]|jgi:hypothetical protein|uniref:hypothetical protein n=4 Tax=uncultured Lamprocystis sp. TaxID=543132 RepID=UPI0025CC0938|nr:hypothetical protein [uncultured Lamprocystis sp.]
MGEVLRLLQALAVRYAFLEQRPDPVAAFAIGGDLYRWLHGDQRLLDRLLADDRYPRSGNCSHKDTKSTKRVGWAERERCPSGHRDA